MHFSTTAKRFCAVGAAIAAAAAYSAQSSVADASGATSSRTWAPAVSAAITPGVQMYTKGAQCTANFVFTDSSGTVYVGYAAHCAGTGEATDTNGCNTKSLPLGTKVSFVRGGSVVAGGEQVGTGELAYSSWLTMQQTGDHNANACAFNDLALVKVDRAFVGDVNPSVPFWGGPVGLDSNGTAVGDQVYSFGNSSLRGGVEALSPKTGLSIGNEGNAWSHNVYTVTPGIPGDSGSGFMDAQGHALGVLSTVQLAPLVGANGVGDLAKEVAYASHHGMSGLEVVPGTKPFSPLL
ncbi:MAG TPA: hypothetical protein VEX15_19855 [Nocardioidaceae bacterium]|nr:hypothetical protein [Nocardioidaceae bacterium]